MLRLLLLAALAVSTFAHVLPISLSNIPEEYKEFIPEEVKKFFKDLTPEDKQILREVASQHTSFPHEDAALEALKQKSEKLYARAVELRSFVKGKIDSLTPDAKAFVEEAIAKARSLRPATGQRPDLEKVKVAVKEIVAKYKALPDAAKEDLKTTFPHTTKMIQHEKFQKLAKSFLEKN